MHSQQQTLVKSVKCSGIGVHSGKEVNLTIKPAPVNHGIKFKRTDLPGQPEVSALFNMVVDTSLATVIGDDGVIISTVEHLMACMAGLSIDNAIIELDSYEMPIMDGSAAQFAELINNAGIANQSNPRYFFVVKQPIELKNDDKAVVVYPSPTCKFTCSIEYDHPLIKKQSHTIDLSDMKFTEEISRARTYGFLHEYEYLKRHGLARGASLESGIAIDGNNVMNEGGLRYKDEFVRHKVLDCIGDFSLLGMPVLGHVVAYKSGHAFNQAFLKEFFSKKEAWETSTIPVTDDHEQLHSKSLAI